MVRPWQRGDVGHQLCPGQRAFHREAAERVGPVEHQRFHSRLGAGTQTIGHRRGVGEAAQAGVLQVDHQRVEAGKVRAAARAVEALHRQAGRRVATVGHRLSRRRAAFQPVFGAEQPDERSAGQRRQPIGSARAGGVDPGGVGQQADAHAAHQIGAVRQHAVEPGADRRGLCAQRRCGEQGRAAGQRRAAGQP